MTLFHHQAQLRQRRAEAQLVRAAAAGAGVPWGGGKAVDQQLAALEKDD